MRVLFFGPTSAVHATRWVRFLRDRGHEVHFATMHAVPPEEDHQVVRLADGLTEGPTSTRTLFQAIGRARDAVRAIKPDVSCAYYMTSYGLLGALAGARPLVGAAAGGDVLVDPFDSLATRIRARLLLGYALRRCAGMLCWGPHVGARLEELGFPREHILVQPRGVNRSLFAFREPRTRAAGEPLRILSIRWLKPLYRVDTLVKALVALSTRGVPFEARIGGEGPERPRLEAMITEAGLGAQVTFLGALHGDEVPGQLAWSDVYVSTSSSDGASSSLFEALSVGAYPVVSDIVANAPFVDPGETGLLFPVGDEGALAAHLETLAVDDAMRRRGVLDARPFVESSLDYGTNMTRIEGFLEAHAR